MSQPNVFMFAGQGTQYYQMGKEFFDQCSIFQEWMQTQNEIVRGINGTSVLNDLYNPDQKKSVPFDQTLKTHPAIFMVGYALAKELMHHGIHPDILLGSSLGEYTALAVAEVIGLEDALTLVVRQAELITHLCPPGGMTGILSPSSYYTDTPILHQNSEISSLNFETNFGISASVENLERIEKHLKAEDILHQRIPVKQAFHSKEIDAVEDAFLRLLKKQSYSSPNVELYSCMSTEAHQTFESDFLWKVVRKPIEFQKTIAQFKTKSDAKFFDLGPSGTLVNFVKYNKIGATPANLFTTMAPFGNPMKNLEKAKSAVSG